MSVVRLLMNYLLRSSTSEDEVGDWVSSTMMTGTLAMSMRTSGRKQLPLEMLGQRWMSTLTMVGRTASCSQREKRRGKTDSTPRSRRSSAIWLVAIR